MTTVYVVTEDLTISERPLVKRYRTPSSVRLVLCEGCQPAELGPFTFPTKEMAIKAAENMYAARKKQLEDLVKERQAELDLWKANLEKNHV